MISSKQHLNELLAEADIEVGGLRPWDLQVHDERVFSRTLAYGSLGFGEAYMDGWWDCKDIEGMLARIFRAGLDRHIIGWRTLLFALSARLVNRASPRRAFEVGRRHYDVGNDLYQAMLDHRMVYTCGYWNNASNLDEAQEAKLDLVCRKIGLKSGMRILDIGCGWGSFAKFAAERYGAEVVGVTVSKRQVELGRELCKGLPVELKLQDYRDINTSQPYDRVVSLGMFEHVGYKNYAEFMRVVRKALKPEGLFLLHTIGANTTRHANNTWIDKYIFPNSMLPSIVQIGRAIEPSFMMEDWHNFGLDYVKTLRAWDKNIEAAWNALETNYDERFRRMWRFYLRSSSATFLARRNQLWQIVLSPHGVKDRWGSCKSR